MDSEQVKSAGEEFLKAVEIYPSGEPDKEIYSYKVVELYGKVKNEYLKKREEEKQKDEEEKMKKAEAERKKAERELAEQMRQEQERFARLKMEKEWGKRTPAVGLSGNYYLIKPDIKVLTVCKYMNFRLNTINYQRYFDEQKTKKITYTDSELGLFLGRKTSRWDFFIGPSLSGIVGNYRVNGKETDLKEERKNGSLNISVGYERNLFNLKAEIKFINRLAFSFSVGY